MIISKMNIYDLKGEQIESMAYNDLISLVRETNRPPGGMRTILAVARSCFLSPGRSVLEIGTATGFTAIKLAQLTGAHITAIDLNINSLTEAAHRANQIGLDHLIEFKREDAADMSFADGSFDVVFCGNVTSLVHDPAHALQEYCRVLKPGGILAAVPMYYTSTPPDELLERVKAALKVNIECHDRAYWMTFFQTPTFLQLDACDFQFENLPESDVQEFCDLILQRPHLRDLHPAAAVALDKLYCEYMQLFRLNLSQMGFTVLTMQKVSQYEEPELFIARAL